MASAKDHSTPGPHRAMPHNREESGNLMTDQKAQELTDTVLDAALSERDKADKAWLPWPPCRERRTAQEVRAQEVREFTDQDSSRTGQTR
jgi:hypothetical protein